MAGSVGFTDVASAALQGSEVDRLHCSAGKLLFQTPVFLLPLHGGQQLRIFNLLRCCARDFDVTFVSQKPATSVDGRPIKSLCERVILFDANARGSKLEGSTSLAS